MMLKDWCRRFSAESEDLREELAAWTIWLANGSPPWAAYRATALKHGAGARTLKGNIESPQTRDAWITTQVNDWAHGATALGQIAKRFTQTPCMDLIKALQNEWTYLQRVATGNGSLYEPIEKAITDDFLPALLS